MKTHLSKLFLTMISILIISSCSNEAEEPAIDNSSKPLTKSGWLDPYIGRDSIQVPELNGAFKIAEAKICYLVIDQIIQDLRYMDTSTRSSTRGSTEGSGSEDTSYILEYGHGQWKKKPWPKLDLKGNKVWHTFMAPLKEEYGYDPRNRKFTIEILTQPEHCYLYDGTLDSNDGSGIFSTEYYLHDEIENPELKYAANYILLVKPDFNPGGYFYDPLVNISHRYGDEMPDKFELGDNIREALIEVISSPLRPEVIQANAEFIELMAHIRYLDIKLCGIYFNKLYPPYGAFVAVAHSEEGFQHWLENDIWLHYDSEEITVAKTD